MSANPLPNLSTSFMKRAHMTGEILHYWLVHSNMMEAREEGADSRRGRMGELHGWCPKAATRHTLLLYQTRGSGERSLYQPAAAKEGSPAQQFGQTAKSGHSNLKGSAVRGNLLLITHRRTPG
jgi:hypothetical protein